MVTGGFGLPGRVLQYRYAGIYLFLKFFGYGRIRKPENPVAFGVYPRNIGGQVDIYLLLGIIADGLQGCLHVSGIGFPVVVIKYVYPERRTLNNCFLLLV